MNRFRVQEGPADKGKKIKKTTKGRQKILIRPLQNRASIQVTFSKRREGIFKKASELCILSGATIGIITFSPDHRRPYYFAHPDNIDLILDHYLRGSSPPPAQLQPTDPAAAASFRELKRDFEDTSLALEEEEGRAGAIEACVGKGRFWWDEVFVEGMPAEELEECIMALKELKQNLSCRANQMMFAAKFPNDQGAGAGAALTDFDHIDNGLSFDHNEIGAAANDGDHWD